MQALGSTSKTHPSGTMPAVIHAVVAAGHIPWDQAQALWQQAQAKNTSVIAALIDSGAVTANALAQTLAKAFATPFFDLGTLDRSTLPQGLLDENICLHHQLIVLGKKNKRLRIATADPSNKEAAEALKRLAPLDFEWVVVEFDRLRQWLASKPVPDTAATAPARNTLNFESLSEQALVTQDTPVVHFLEKLLNHAVQLRASDVHLEPYEKSLRVRFRVDGVLREVATPPLHIKENLASRIKVLARIDIAEKRIPQDGAMKFSLPNGSAIDCRVNSLPTLFGEKIVIRILNSNHVRMGMDALGYEDDDKARLLAAIGRPFGMILATGPTGSGKTVSLYACLDRLNQASVNIITVENPSEIHFSGINQVNVNEKAGLTFATALRSFLRQDPDIIMVGEIRDAETADIAVKAALTGHLLLSTLHTNDAPSTVTRLRHMGVASFHIASSVTLITAQRLVRRLCEHCKVPARISPKSLRETGFLDSDLDSSWQPYQAVGCAQCHKGYTGRMGIFQVMPISEAIQQIILRDGSAIEIAHQAQQEGVRSLRRAGLLKVKRGLTSIEEVLAVTNE